MLVPSASRPPSAKKKAWITSTEEIVRNAAWGPSSSESSSPPPRWPEEPVPGIVKLIICAAKMKAPSTPISGTLWSSSVFLILLAQYASTAPEALQNVTPTAGESRASAMCIVSFQCLFCGTG